MLLETSASLKKFQSVMINERKSHNTIKEYLFIVSKFLEFAGKPADRIGVLTGRESKLDLGKIYTEEMKIVGSTGGTPSEFEGLLNISQEAGFKVRVHKKMDIWNFKEAISEYEKVRDGRILLRIE